MTCNLQTQYLGLTLANPLVVSSCPMTDHLDVVKRLVDAGAAAVVLPSLFQEQVEHDAMELQNWQMYGSESSGEAVNYFPAMDRYNDGGSLYLRKIEEARRAVSIPVMASLNGTSKGGWARFASRMEQAGANALELNIYLVPTNPDETGGDVEE
jgi:dihydroorotate dehydrogenase (fumarate)